MSESNAVSTAAESVSTEQTENDPKKLAANNERLLKQLAAEREKNRAFEAAKKEAEAAKLTEQQQFKTLAENYKQEIDKLSSELTGMKKAQKEAKIKEQIKSELFKLGLKPEYADDALKIFDRDQVQVDDETLTVHGVDLAAKKFHEKYASVLFGKSTQIGRQPAAMAGAPGAQKFNPKDYKNPKELMEAYKNHKGLK